MLKFVRKPLCSTCLISYRASSHHNQPESACQLAFVQFGYSVPCPAVIMTDVARMPTLLRQQSEDMCSFCPLKRQSSTKKLVRFHSIVDTISISDYASTPAHRVSSIPSCIRSPFRTKRRHLHKCTQGKFHSIVDTISITDYAWTLANRVSLPMVENYTSKSFL